MVLVQNSLVAAILIDAPSVGCGSPTWSGEDGIRLGTRVVVSKT